MKKLGEMLPRRQPRPDELQAIADVIVIAHQWARGECTLQDVRDSCSGYHRWLANCCVSLSAADGRAVQDLTTALADDDDLRDGKTINLNAGSTMQPPLYLSREQIGQLGYVQMTNHQGRRVWVSPLYGMRDEWHYPLVHLPPGEERREREAAMVAAYHEYRRGKKGRGHRDGA
jgi:hypothetical protein